MKRQIMMICILAIMGVIFIVPANGASYLYRVAVLPFDDGSIKDHWWSKEFQLASGITDELITSLAETKRFLIIERGEIEAVLKEQNLSKEELLDPKTAVKVGKILGVQYLLLERVTEFTSKNDTTVLGNPNANNPMGIVLNTTVARVTLDARMVDTTTAEILTSVTGTGERKNIILGAATKQGLMVFGAKDFEKSDLGRAMRQAVTSVAYQLANKAYDGFTIPNLTINGKIAYVSPENIIMNVGTGDGVEVGMVFIVRHLVDQVKNPETGEIVDDITEPVAEIVVTTVKEKSATCKIVAKLSSKFTIAVKDRVVNKEPIKVTALPPLELPATEVTEKTTSGKLYVDATYFTDCRNQTLFEDDKSDGSMYMFGGGLTFYRFIISGEKGIASEVKSGSGKVDVSEYKIGYDLNNNSDYKIVLYVSNLMLKWNDGAVTNSSWMLGADVGYDIADKTYLEASFGYGMNPSTTVNGVEESSWTNITTVQVKVDYAIAENIDLYAGYRSYMISRQQDQNLSGITAGLALKF